MLFRLWPQYFKELATLVPVWLLSNEIKRSQYIKDREGKPNWNSTYRLVLQISVGPYYPFYMFLPCSPPSHTFLLNLLASPIRLSLLFFFKKNQLILSLSTRFLLRFLLYSMLSLRFYGLQNDDGYKKFSDGSAGWSQVGTQGIKYVGRSPNDFNFSTYNTLKLEFNFF